MRTKQILMVAVTSALAAPSLAQVAPASPPPNATPTLKAGWIAQAVSFNNGKIGAVPLASAIVGAAQSDAFAVLAKKTTSPFGGLLLRGEINAPETGKYGVLLNIQAAGQGFCNTRYRSMGRNCWPTSTRRRSLPPPTRPSR